METSSSKSNLDTNVAQCSPPRSSDSDWSDINTDEENNITDDEDTGDKLIIDISKKRKRGNIETETQNNLDLSSTKEDQIDAKNEYSKEHSGTKRLHNSLSRSLKDIRRGNYKRKIRYSGNTDVPNEILDAVAGAKGDSFNLRLDKAAKRMRLNRTQVKSVLRKLVESPDLLNFAMEKAGDKPGSSQGTQAEPRITRKLAKHVVKSGGKLNWFLEKVAQTPQKKDTESLTLLVEEFPEDDPDQDYDPTEDMEALKVAGAKALLESSKNDASEDDNFIPSDVDCTPGGTSSVGGDDSILQKTPESEGSTSLALRKQQNQSPSFEFKQPSSNYSEKSSHKLSGSQSRLQQDRVSSVARLLNFEQPTNIDNMHYQNKYSNNGQEICINGKSPIRPSRNTRSKASLKDVSIDELAPMTLEPGTEQLLPDINFDMYEAIEDENEKLFQEFLKQTMRDQVSSQKPDNTNLFDDVDNACEELLGGEDNDPDYEFNQLVEEHPPDEYKYNRSTKIPQKEVDALMQELLEAYSIKDDQTDSVTESSAPSRSGKSRIDESNFENSQNDTESENNAVIELTRDQHAMIGQQMRQHIQLLTQMTLLTSYDPMWQTLNQHCKEMTNELFTKSLIINSTNQQPISTSIFAQNNLFPSLGVVQEWEKLSENPSEVAKTTKGEKYNLSPKLINFMANKSGAFIYPQLLPHSAISPAEDKMVFWSGGEDELIALQLEEYERSNPNTKKSQANCLKDIHKNLIRNKTVPQIRSRYKNQTKRVLVEKGKSDINTIGSGPMNAILYYKEHRKAPRNSELYRLLPHEGNSAWMKLKDMPVSDFPINWRKYILKLNGIDATEGGGEISDPKTIPDFSSAEKANTNLKDSDKEATEVIEKSDTIIMETEVTESTINMGLSHPYSSNTVNTNLCSSQTTYQTPINIGFSANSEELVQSQISLYSQEYSQNSQQVASSQISLYSQDNPQAPVNYQENSVLANQNANQYMNIQYDGSLIDMQIEAPNEEALRREHEAMEIVLCAKDALTDSAKIEQFFHIIQTCQNSPIQAFEQLHNLCKGIPELQELLLDLLTPSQALELSPIVYAQHCLRNDMKKFCQKIRKAYANNPSNQAGQNQITKIFKELHNFISQDKEHSVDDLRSFATKLFKGQDQIIDSFISFLPGHAEEKSKVWNSIEPEIIDLSDEENETPNALNANEQNQFQGYEHIKNIPETEEEKLFGTEQCPCQCHPKNLPASNHCIHCSIRFINGKIYAREGKILKPVRVKYPAGKNPFLQNGMQ